jgi:anti-sigma factor RsiW
MNTDLLNILSHSNKDIDNQKLMDYLSGNLPEDEKHEVEQLMADSDFMSDAMEGLEHLKNKKELQLYVKQLNKNLQNQLKKKKNRREKRRINEYPWIYFAIILILVFCVIGYVVIRQFMH